MLIPVVRIDVAVPVFLPTTCWKCNSDGCIKVIPGTSMMAVVTINSKMHR